MNQNIIKKLNDSRVSFEDFYNYLRDQDIGYWDGVNDEDIIKQYITEMSSNGIHVSHMLQAIEENPSSQELYCIWLGNSMETPTPINTKQDLFEALELSET